MTIKIQFIPGLDEPVIPEIRLTRSSNGTTGTATFRFKKPKILDHKWLENKEIKGMRLIDNETLLDTKRLFLYFVNGKPEVIEAIYIIKTGAEWATLLNLLKKFGKQANLTFIKAEQ